MAYRRRSCGQREKQFGMRVGPVQGAIGEGKACLATNAPLDWPAVTQLPTLPFHCTREQLEDHVAATLRRMLTTRDSRLRRVRRDRAILLESGVLEVPIALDFAGGCTIAVFAFPTASPYAAIEFASIRAALLADGRCHPVYYSTEALPAASLCVRLQDLDLKHFRLASSIPPGRYTAWHLDDANPSAEAGSVPEDITRAYVAADGVEPQILSRMLQAWEGRDSAGEVDLPEIALKVRLVGPQDIPMIMSASSTRGIRMHLPVDRTTSVYRSRV